MTDSDAFLDFFESLPMVQMTSDMCEDIKRGNGEVARGNIKFEEEIETLRAEIQSLHTMLSDKRRGLASMVRRQQNVLSRYSVERIAERLGAAAADAEADSEDMADSFMDGDMTLDEFCKAYVNGRVLYHSRAAKLECLKGGGV